MPLRFRRAALAGALALVAGATFVPSAGADAATPRAAAQPFIVGGEEASLADHPYAVFLADGGGNQYCGGVLVGSRSVATAAHCALAVRRTDLKVVAGREDKRSRDGWVVGVRDVWIAPGYKEPSGGNDLAVLTLRDRVPYRSAKVADAGDAGLYAAGTKATVIGWGRTSAGGARSNTVRRAQVPVVSDSDCGKAFRSYDAKTMLCAGYPEGGVDACQGDSGGPLMVGNTVIGIVSWGEGCAEAGKPGVYTRVSSYAEQIREQIG
ncbi:Trypsin [Amycolatopsis marina]|uniref:Trypsin n=1 Tax=Amycolatopsis marina TaxID=490629 RepID=A0A1I0WM68_9PSEU|nr:serine protease [Amycolatopsis marina]SFA89056.1 Trypsin [Amycolatopsis marina]